MTSYTKITDSDLASGALYDKVNDMADALNAGKLEKAAFGSRKASTTYTAGAIVKCEYHGDLLLKCTTAGTTGNGALDTSGSLSAGATLSDGTVVWTAVTAGTVRSINGLTPDASGNIAIGTGTTWNLLDRKWSDHILNDIRWLRADNFSWQNGDLYELVYSHLTDDIDGKSTTTETVAGITITYYLADDGHKIVPASNASAVESLYNATGAAWYYILDTVNERFKLPRENPAREELIQVLRAKGNDITIGLTDGTNSMGLYRYGNNNKNAPGLQGAALGTDVGTTVSTPEASSSPYKTLGLTTDSTKSGIVSDMTESTSVYKGNSYLYFYVGAYSTPAIEQTAGVTSEVLASKQDVADLVTSVSSSSTDSQYPSAKCLYELCGDVESLINAL